MSVYDTMRYRAVATLRYKEAIASSLYDDFATNNTFIVT